MGFLDGPDSKESTFNALDLGSVPGGGNGNPFQCSCLENAHEQRGLASYNLWGRKESDMTERLSTESIYRLKGSQVLWKKTMKRESHLNPHLAIFIVITKLRKISNWKSKQAMFKGIKFMLSSKLIFAKQNTEGMKSTTVQHSLDENIFEKHELYIVQVVFHLLRSSQDMPEKAVAPHSSTLAWKIPWAEEPGRLQSMGLLGVGHD